MRRVERVRRGGGPGWWEPCWCAGEPVALELASDHGREDGVVAGEQRAVAVLRFASIVREAESSGRGEILAQFCWATTATSTDVASFLKASVRHLVVLPSTQGESLGLRIGRWRRFGVVILLRTPPWSP